MGEESSVTCIAAVVDEGTVWMGGDSAGVSGWNLTLRKDAKVFLNGTFLIGFTTSFRMGQLLRYSFKPPVHPEGVDTYEFMVTAAINSMRTCLKDGGFSKKDKEAEEGGTFLVGYRGRLFEINSDYQVAEPLDHMAAVGAGEQVACGALYALLDLDPEQRILRALEVAERFNAAVRGPFIVRCLVRDEEGVRQ